MRGPSILVEVIYEVEDSRPEIFWFKFIAIPRVGDVIRMEVPPKRKKLKRLRKLDGEVKRVEWTRAAVGLRVVAGFHSDEYVPQVHVEG